MSKSSEPPVAPPQAPPFLLTRQQGRAARTLLSYIAALPLQSADAQLLGVVGAIRAARGGTGNISGLDMRSLKLTDPEGAVAELRGIGWQIPDALLHANPETPVPLSVPDLLGGTGHPLPFGKQTRSRVSGWVVRTLGAKPVKKAEPAVRLGGLYLAGHSTSDCEGTLPEDLPLVCRAALPALLDAGFLAALSGDGYHLGDKVRHLAGQLPGPDEAEEGDAATPATPRVPAQRTLTPQEWESWKDKASPALRRHVEAVEGCTVCSISTTRVATAFTDSRELQPAQEDVREACAAWWERNPDCGEQAARFTVAFRAEHGHGPSYGQLCKSLGWRMPRRLRSCLVGRLLTEQWLTDTAPVPWTLRPGSTAQGLGIVLPDRSRQSNR